MIPMSSQWACNTSANCVVDQRPQLPFRFAFESIFALIELSFAPTDLLLPPVHFPKARMVVKLLQPFFLAVQLGLLARDRALFGRQRHCIGEEYGCTIDPLGVLDQPRMTIGAHPEKAIIILFT